ncbi:carbohydrate kinase family protein [Thalassotalea fusca]
MKPVICFGEALIDFLNTGAQADGCLSLNNYCQYPGGAPANAAVAVARLGGNAYFAGQVGDDVFGHFLEQALEKYGVNVNYLVKHEHASTALAFVTLDDTGDRSFSFYRQQTADMLFDKTQIQASWFNQEVIFHFCSNTLTEAAIAETTKLAVEMAKSNDAFVSFDVNLRHNLWPSGQADCDLVNELVYHADVIKFSRDEFTYLSQGNEQQYIDTCLSRGVSLLVITDGEHDIEFITLQGKQSVSAPAVKAIDTTAGGDAFSGALLMAFSCFEQPKAALRSFDTLLALIQFAAHCGAHTVTKPGAFPALPSFSEVEQHWPSAYLPQLPTKQSGASHAVL